MANYEKGHAKNAANFEKLTTYTASLGEEYNPSNTLLKIDALQALLAKANDSLNAVNAAHTAYSGAISKRRTSFKPLNKLITKVGNSYKSCGATKEDKQNVLSVTKKLKGVRVSSKLTPEQKKELEGNSDEKKQISASQTSFDNKLNFFDRLIKLLESNPLYAPNEEPLKTASLEALHDDLKAMNTAAFDTAVNLINARNERNKIMYAEETGLVDITLEVKNYLKSLEGATDPKYKAISNLSFVNVK